MLDNNREEVILYNLCGPQLLANIPSVIFMAQIPDQIFNTLCNLMEETIIKGFTEHIFV